MDPVATFVELDRAMTARDRERIAEVADGLVGWLEKGGFLPELDDWRRELSRHGMTCYLRDVRHVAEMV